jgi:hypothetical protein
MIRRKILMVSLLLSALVWLTVPVHASDAPSPAYNPVRGGNWSAVHFGGVNLNNLGPNEAVATGHIGVDIALLQPDINGGKLYLPCHANSVIETLKVVCPDKTNPSYYKIETFSIKGAKSFPYGIFIDNATIPYGETEPREHNWGKKVQYVGLEIYPHSVEPGYTNVYDPPWNKYGGVRISLGGTTANAFPDVNNGGNYSANLGTVTELPIKGQSPFLNGYGYTKTSPQTPAQAGAFSVDLFQLNTTHYTTQAWPMHGFASTGNRENNGYYTSGPVFPGRYMAYVTLHQPFRKIQMVVDINGLQGDRLDFHFDNPARCFGYVNVNIPNHCPYDSKYDPEP